MAHALPDQEPTWRERIVAAWGGRAVIRRNLTIAASDALALTVAFQVAFPDIGVERSAIFSTITRILGGVGLWLTSRAWLRVTGELPRTGENGDASA